MKSKTSSITWTVALAVVLSLGAGIGTTGSAAQRGQSPVYQFDVVQDGAVVGKLTVNTTDAQLPSYLLVAQGLAPNTRYTFGCTVSGEEYALWSKETPKAGAFVIKGTFPLNDVEVLETAEFWVVETPPSGSYMEVNGLHLDNDGWFVARLACYYSTDDGVTWEESSHTSDITINHDRSARLEDLGVPDGAIVRIHAIVVAGKDRTGTEVWQCSYAPACPNGLEKSPAYLIKGTTGNPKLTFEFIYGWNCEAN